LREAMDWLRDKIIPVYTTEALKYFQDPWVVRDEYIDVILDRSRKNIEAFLKKHAVKKLSKSEMIRASKLLEMQRNAMLMYTSCGWFFDDISGIETIQIMQYALMTIQYMEDLQGVSLNHEYLKILREAKSNKSNDTLEIYKMFVEPARSDLLRVGIHYCISSIFEEYPEDAKIFCYTAKSEKYIRKDAGELRLATGKAKITSDITLEEETISFAVLYLGNLNISGGTSKFTREKNFSIMQNEMNTAFDKGNTDAIRSMDKHFEGNIYSIWHLFKDEQRKVLDQLFRLTYDEVATCYRQVYENNLAIMNTFHDLQIKLPMLFLVATEYILNTDIKQVFQEVTVDIDKLSKLIDEAIKWNIKIDTTTLTYVASTWLSSTMDNIRQHTEDLQLFENIDKTLEVLNPLSLSLDLWKVQNNYFAIWKDFYITMKDKEERWKNFYTTMKDKEERGDSFAKSWVENFLKLGHYLNVKI